MATSEDILDKVAKLLDKLNEPSKNESTLEGWIKSPLIATIVGGIVVTAGSLYVTKAFQVRDEQTLALSAFEEQFQSRLAITNQLAMIRATTQEQDCGVSENKDKQLENPFVIGLTGKTCIEAEAEHNRVYGLYIDKPANTSLARIRATFKNSSVDAGAKNLSAFVSVLVASYKHTCIIEVYNRANMAYQDLLEIAIDEIEGNFISTIPSSFDLTGLENHCDKNTLCAIPVIRNSADIECQDAAKP